MLLRKEGNMARPNYIHEWENMPRCYNPLGCPFKTARQGSTDRRCCLRDDDCNGKDKEAVKKFITPKQKDIVLTEQQRAIEASGLSNRCLQWRIETTESLLNQTKELDLEETAKVVQTCLEIYTKERENRKEARTWEQARKW